MYRKLVATSPNTAMIKHIRAEPVKFSLRRLCKYAPVIKEKYVNGLLAYQVIKFVMGGVTKMDTPKSEIRWETGTHFCILCYPYYKMKGDRKQARVRPTVGK